MPPNKNLIIENLDRAISLMIQPTMNEQEKAAARQTKKAINAYFMAIQGPGINSKHKLDRIKLLNYLHVIQNLTPDVVERIANAPESFREAKIRNIVDSQPRIIGNLIANAAVELADASNSEKDRESHESLLKTIERNFEVMKKIEEGIITPTVAAPVQKPKQPPRAANFADELMEPKKQTSTRPVQRFANFGDEAGSSAADETVNMLLKSMTTSEAQTSPATFSNVPKTSKMSQSDKMTTASQQTATPMAQAAHQQTEAPGVAVNVPVPDVGYQNDQPEESVVVHETPHMFTPEPTQQQETTQLQVPQAQEQMPGFSVPVSRRMFDNIGKTYVDANGVIRTNKTISQIMLETQQAQLDIARLSGAGVKDQRNKQVTIDELFAEIQALKDIIQPPKPVISDVRIFPLPQVSTTDPASIYYDNGSFLDDKGIARQMERRFTKAKPL